MGITLMDFLKNTKNGRVLPWSPELAKLPHMGSITSPKPEVVAEPEPESPLVSPPEKPKKPKAAKGGDL